MNIHPEGIFDFEVFPLKENMVSDGHGNNGKELFVASCAPCHGNSGAGDGPSSASLMDDWNHPCRPADLRTPNTRIGRTFTALHRVLLTGIDGTPMPSFAESLSEEQRWEVVAYIVSLRSESQAKTDAGTIPK